MEVPPGFSVRSSQVIPIALAAMGCAALFLALLALRRLPGYRVARVLWSAPEATVAEAVAAAERRERRYLRVRGRITSDEEFPDEHNRPLVFRRTRLEVAEKRGAWRVLEEERLAVPFGVQDRADSIRVDADVLDEGVVVLVRESTGFAREVPERLPSAVPPDAAIRHRVDQISAVEHAIVAGVPHTDADGVPVLTEGLGRPLILTTLEVPEAMRLLAAGRRGAVALAAGSVAVGLSLLAVSLVTWLAGIAAPT